MTTPTPMLDPSGVAELMTMLLGRDVTAAETTKGANPYQHPGATVATYVDDKGGLRAIIALDLALTAYAGSALAVMGPRVAEDAIRSTLINQALYDNTYEVLNVMGSLFNVPGAPHVRLGEMFAPREFPSEPVSSLVQGGGTPHAHIEVDVSGYGGGRMTVLVP